MPRSTENDNATRDDSQSDSYRAERGDTHRDGADSDALRDSPMAHARSGASPRDDADEEPSSVDDERDAASRRDDEADDDEADDDDDGDGDEDDEGASHR